MIEEHLATYIYDINDPDGVYEIYAIHDDVNDISNRKISFYDIFTKDGICVNKEDHYYNLPSWEYVYNKYYKPRSKLTAAQRFALAVRHTIGRAMII